MAREHPIASARFPTIEHHTIIEVPGSMKKLGKSWPGYLCCVHKNCTKPSIKAARAACMDNIGQSHALLHHGINRDCTARSLRDGPIDYTCCSFGICG